MNCSQSLILCSPFLFPAEVFVSNVSSLTSGASACSRLTLCPRLWAHSKSGATRRNCRMPGRDLRILEPSSIVDTDLDCGLKISLLGLPLYFWDTSKSTWKTSRLRSSLSHSTSGVSMRYRHRWQGHVQVTFTSPETRVTQNGLVG